MFPPAPIKYSAQFTDEQLKKIGREFSFPRSDFIQINKLTIAPSRPQVGMVFLADGVHWDPLSLAGSDAYFVWYTGTTYRGLHETAAGTNLV